MKKFTSVILAALLLVSALSLSGCGASESKASAGELNLYVWTEYLPQEVIDEFTNQTGIKVNVTMYSNNEEMLSKVKSSTEGTYDVIVPSDYMVENMVTQGLLEKLDMTQIENIKNIDSAYLKQSFDPDNSYSVPYRGGVCELVVNTTMVTEEISSYN